MEIRHKASGKVLLELKASTLREAWLADARLVGADLSFADLRGANLARADLTGADLIGADLSFADLRGTVLELANLTGARLRGARYDATTRRPPGISFELEGAVFAAAPPRPAASAGGASYRRADRRLRRLFTSLKRRGGAR